MIAILSSSPRQTRSSAAWKLSAEISCRTTRTCRRSSPDSSQGNKWLRTPGLGPRAGSVRSSVHVRSSLPSGRHTRTREAKQETGNDSRSRRFCAEQQVCGVGDCRLVARLGSRLVSQPAGGGLSRYRRQLRDGHYPMAGPFRGGGGAAGHDSDRDSNGRNAAHDLSALRVDFRPVVRDHDLRRQLRTTTGTGRRCWNGSPRSIFLRDKTFSLKSARTGAPSARFIGTRCEAQIPATT